MIELPGDFLFQLVPIIFLVVFGIILFTLFKGLFTWSKNNNQPRLTTDARVVAKRTSVRGGGETQAYTIYYVTFEFESGNRSEFQVKGPEYGKLVEGDRGELHFQGTRFLGFTRQKPNI